MSIAIITVRDDGDDGDVKVNVEFEPPLAKDGETPSTHLVALKMLDAVATPDDIINEDRT